MRSTHLTVGLRDDQQKMGCVPTVITLRPFIYVSMLFGAIFVSSSVNGCKKSANEAQKKPTEKRVVSIPQNRTGYHREGQNVQGLRADKSSLQEQIEILGELINNFEAINNRFTERNEQDLLIFTNPVEQTLRELRKYKSGYEGYGILHPPETLAQAGLDYITFTSPEYWRNLKSALQGYGYLESGKIRTSTNALLMAKGFFETSFPTDVFLIKEGSHRGFFTRENLDLVVPGIRFYQDVLGEKIRIDLFPKIDQYFKSSYESALALIEKGQVREGIKSLESFLRNYMVPEELKSDVYYNMAVAHEMLGEYFEAIATYNTSISIKPSAISCYMRGRLYVVLGMYRNALDSFNQALPITEDPAMIANIRKGISICTDNIEPK